MNTEIGDDGVMEFLAFPKIARLSREMVITEKLDGTNAHVVVFPDGSVLAASRNRYITVEDDNYGFARWVAAHKEELRVGLGVGRHYGEWWGAGIQRGYGLTGNDKRFSLFNTARWGGNKSGRPACCGVVPVLYTGAFDTWMVEGVMAALRNMGSEAVQGFMQPEGVVVYHKGANMLFKKTVEKDEEPKGLRV